MRIAPALVLTIVLLAAPAAAEARSGPCRTGDVPRVKVRSEQTRTGWRFAIVACDAARQVRILRRTRYRSNRHGALGRSLTSAGGAGAHVAWTELVHRRWHESAVVVVADRRGRVTRRRTIWRGAARAEFTPEVAVLRDGTVAWTRPAGRTVAIVLARPGRRPRPFGRGLGAYLGADDSRTLRWLTEDRTVAFRDLLPLPVRGGCPRRERFSTVSETPGHRVTRGGFPIEEEVPIDAILRVCVRAERRDVVVSQSADAEVTFLTRGWAVLAARSGDRNGCNDARVKSVSLRDGATAHAASVSQGCGNVPRPGDPHAVTPAGRVAWLDAPYAGDFSRPPETEEVLRATGPAGRAVELDRGAPGAIAGLRTDGETYHWTNAGASRSAPAP